MNPISGYSYSPAPQMNVQRSGHVSFNKKLISPFSEIADEFTKDAVEITPEEVKRAKEIITHTN